MQFNGVFVKGGWIARINDTDTSLKVQQKFLREIDAQCDDMIETRKPDRLS